MVYYEEQKREQKCFADAVSFACLVITDKRLKEFYIIKATLLRFRSAWNVVIAEYTSEEPLKVKKKKIAFDKQIRMPSGRKLKVKLYKRVEEKRFRFLLKYRGKESKAGILRNIGDTAIGKNRKILLERFY